MSFIRRIISSFIFAIVAIVASFGYVCMGTSMRLAKLAVFVYDEDLTKDWDD